ncbi:dienelactone hydrolase family protein [Paraflavitalea sp. CAU 1676]|uniref:dienelactone hydrolase family protein n=1 Tax=Paraflavitalea sp. CAU 1676 TaxID=3032598 RepID=UPI0023DBA619|nr:dienelactone hydrolase family protein [Paraflavitalea sp. CAU 1676]MDF2191949.1 dienelactone hydrolase family protein [Paraflavitalea sp. CAU 1676]
MKYVAFLPVLLTINLFLTSCGDQAAKTDTTAAKTDSVRLFEGSVEYSADTAKLIGFVAYNEATDQKRPAVLVIPEWWGLNEYPKDRARQLANLGYIAFVADMYGNGLVVDSPSLANAQASRFYTNPALAGSRFMAALNKLKTYPQVDSSKLAAIGYCFGGSIVLNAAKLGAPVNGVVSFHGDLRGVPADKKLLKAKILVAHGAADSFVPQEQVDAFKKQMDSIGADYTFKAYPDAVHAFTNPGATAIGEKFGLNIKYNAAADTASWKEMQDFFGRIFK